MQKPRRIAKQSNRKPRTITTLELELVQGGKWYVPELDSDRPPEPVVP